MSYKMLQYIDRLMESSMQNSSLMNPPEDPIEGYIEKNIVLLSICAGLFLWLLIVTICLICFRCQWKNSTETSVRVENGKMVKEKQDFIYEGCRNMAPKVKQEKTLDEIIDQMDNMLDDSVQYTSIDKTKKSKPEELEIASQEEESDSIASAVDNEIKVAKYPQIVATEEPVTYTSVDKPKQATVTVMGDTVGTLVVPKSRMVDYTEVVINADTNPEESAKMATERAELLFSEYAEIRCNDVPEDDVPEETML